jgi:hypothetical protein
VEEEEEQEEVVGMEYLVSLADVWMQVFLFFRMSSRRWGWNIGVSCGCGDASFSIF